MRRRVLLAVALVTTAATVSGCYDRQELEQQAFVTGMAIDTAPHHLLDYTLQIALPKSSQAGGGGGGAQPLASKGPVTYRAHTITEALAMANSSIERSVTLSHLNWVLFGEDSARQGIEPQLAPLVRFREFRRTVFVSVAKGKAKDVMEKISPLLESSNTRVAEDISALATHSGFVPIESHLHDFVTSVQTPHESPTLPVFAVNDQVSEQGGGGGIKTNKVDESAGKVPRSGGDPVEWLGAAVFRKDKYVAYLDGRDETWVRLLSGTLRRTRLDVDDPNQSGMHIGIAVTRERAPTYTIQLGNPLRISMNVPLDGDLLSADSGIDYTRPAMRRKLERQISSSMGQQMLQVVNRLNQQQLDAIQFSRHIRKDFPTYQAFVNYPWEERLKTANVSIHADLHIRRFGILNQPLKSVE